MILQTQGEEIFQENSKKMSEANFQYFYRDQLSNLQLSLLELTRKLSFSDLYKNLMSYLIQNMKNIKSIQDLNSKETIIIKKELDKLKIENDNLRGDNFYLKTTIKSVKYNKMDLKNQYIYLIQNRISLNLKLKNEQRIQKVLILDLKDMPRIERNKNNLLL